MMCRSRRLFPTARNSSPFIIQSADRIGDCMRFLATALTLLAFASLPASAHVSVNDGFSFAAGLEHPATGLDHLTAMVAVGLWAALAGGRRLWIWPLAFVASMLGGGALAHSGITIPYTEPAIAASVFLLGLAIAL